LDNATEVAELKAFISELKLNDIRCCLLNFTLDENATTNPDRFEFKMDEKIDYGFVDNNFIYKIGATVKLMSGELCVGTLATRYVVINEYSGKESPKVETIQHFLQSSGIIVLMPYIREVIQSTMTRFGLGTLAIDYFSVQQ
jgi:preprotein translocase subunit SecB